MCRSNMAQLVHYSIYEAVNRARRQMKLENESEAMFAVNGTDYFYDLEK